MRISNDLTAPSDRTQESLKKWADNNMPDEPFISKITCVNLVSGKYGNLYNQLYSHKMYSYTLLINYLKNTEYMNNSFRSCNLKSGTEGI